MQVIIKRRALHTKSTPIADIDSSLNILSCSECVRIITI